jgi:hypothetical protein
MCLPAVIEQLQRSTVIALIVNVSIAKRDIQRRLDFEAMAPQVTNFHFNANRDIIQGRR